MDTLYHGSAVNILPLRLLRDRVNERRAWFQGLHASDRFDEKGIEKHGEFLKYFNGASILLHNSFILVSYKFKFRFSLPDSHYV